MENPQEYNALELTYEDNSLEFIRHQDLHYWVYYNGVKTDARFPRHENFNKNMGHYEMFQKIWFGQSTYNKRVITKFFQNIVPEEFL